MNNSKIIAGHPEGVSRIYTLLASVFRDTATIQFIKEIKAPPFGGVLEDLGIQFDNDFNDRVVDDQLVEDLAVEFTGLFIGPANFISAHESFFHKRGDSDWGNLWGADTVRVKKFIESAGLSFTVDYGGIPDHISIELDFISKISEQVEKAMAEEDWQSACYFLNMKKLFFDDHLMQWAPEFCQKVISKAQLSFYREMARFLEGFLEYEDSGISEDLVKVESKLGEVSVSG